MRLPYLALIGLVSLMLTPQAHAVECLQDGFVSTTSPWPDYAASNPVVLASCTGTNHQTINTIERVVFLGDSATVGTSPSTSEQFYRSLLADQLATLYGLAAPSPLWKNVDPINGTSLVMESGGFASCAKWGARTDDLLGGGMQLATCFPAAKLGLRTLVIMTVGGNDFSFLAQSEASGATPAQLQAELDAAMAELRSAVEWLVAPGRFPNGVFVVIANPLEITDLVGEATSCPGWGVSGIVSYDPVQALITAGNEEVLQIAVDNGIDVVFARERFCGHGWNATSSAAPCYRGAGAANWLDDTCIHPNPTGHGELAADFFEVVTTAAPLPAPALGPGALTLLALALAGGGALRALRARG